MLRRRLLLLPGMPLNKGGDSPVEIVFLLLARFEGPDIAAADMPAEFDSTTPYVDVGTLTITDGGDVWRLEANKLDPTKLNVTVQEPRAVTQQILEQSGLLMIADVNANSGSAWFNVGLVRTGYSNIQNTLSGFLVRSDPSQANICNINNFYIAPLGLNDINIFRFGVWYGDNYIFKFVGDTLVTVDKRPAAADVLGIVAARNSTGVTAPTCDLIGIRLTDPPAFEANNVIAPASGVSYTGSSANAIHHVTLTAPNPLAESAYFYYRYTDADNHWRAGFDSAGAFRVDSVAAGVSTNRVNTASAIGAGQTRTIMVIVDGTKHNFYTISGTTVTKRGAEINLSLNDGITPVRVEPGAGWSASSLLSWNRHSSAYSALQIDT